LHCSQDYENKEVIVVDNASKEEGTDEYLQQLRDRGITVHKTSERDPHNEFAKALNYIVGNSSGDYVCPITGDMQFIIKQGWLKKYINFYEMHKQHIGTMALDAQRKIRVQNHAPFGMFDEKTPDEDFRFYADFKRRPVCGSGNGIYSREILDAVYPWSLENDGHESAANNDSENKMWAKVEKLQSKGIISEKIYHVVPQIPVTIGIYTDSRGTMARVRGNQRFGDYWSPKEDFRYYKIYETDEILKMRNINQGLPLSIEMVAEPIGWSAPLDNEGNWLKNPIRASEAKPEDFTDI
jgi:glycosyltransferase involved in cell wall biosynthesis